MINYVTKNGKQSLDIKKGKMTCKELELVTDAKLLGPNSGADNHAPTNMTFPTSGMWKLDAILMGNYLVVFM
ncbi:hypothetical protein [Lysinibacillus xylanilyticus]|uniref:hypothetical protein n=1 Tax=Lysinibacillus xylanilyticus TaxID=582475 RepID=UPI003CFF4A3D